MSVLYSFPTERGLAIYSDDNGKTWKRGGIMHDLVPGASRASETQIAEAPDGTVLAFARGGSDQGFQMYESTDGGNIWNTDPWGTGLFDGASNGLMISIINLRKTIAPNGNPIVAISHTGVRNRNDGTVTIAELGKNVQGKWRLVYKSEEGSSVAGFQTKVGKDDADAVGKRFGYSVLTELPNGNLGLLNDGFDSFVLEYYEIGLNRR
ncbi:MAG: sialidase family protein [Brevinema sp.]